MEIVKDIKTGSNVIENIYISYNIRFFVTNVIIIYYYFCQLSFHRIFSSVKSSIW